MAFDEWLTCPESVLPRVRRVMPEIDLDPASNDVAAAYIGARRYCVAPDTMGPLAPNCIRDGLSIPWLRNVWCNPPYSAGLIDAFTSKLLAEWRAQHIDQAIYLVNSSTDSQWYHDALAECNAALLWRGRIKFWKIFDGAAHRVWEGQKSIEDRAKDLSLKPKIGNSPMYQSSLFYFGSNVQTFVEAFSGCGVFVKTLNASKAAAFTGKTLQQVSLFDREAA